MPSRSSLLFICSRRREGAFPRLKRHASLSRSIRCEAHRLSVLRDDILNIPKVFLVVETRPEHTTEVGKVGWLVRVALWHEIHRLLDVRYCMFKIGEVLDLVKRVFQRVI